MPTIAALSPREGLQAVVATIRARARIVVTFGLLAALATIVVNASMSERATLTMAFESNAPNSTLVSLGVVALPNPSVATLVSDGVLGRILVDQLPGRFETVEQVRELVSVEGEPAKGAAVLTTQSDSPEDAVRLAAAWANAISLNRRDVIQAQLQAVADSLSAEVRTARRRGRRGREAGRLALARLGRVQAAQQTIGSDAVVTRAASPSVRAGHLNELVFLLGGCLAGVLVALARDLWEGRLRTAAAVRVAFGAPVLGSVGSSNYAGAGALPAAAVVEARLAAVGGGRALVVITGTHGADEPAEVGRQLAVDMREAGRQTELLLWSQAGGTEAIVARRERVRAERTLVCAPPPTRVPEVLALGQRADLWLVAASLHRTRSQDAAALEAGVEGLPHHPDGGVLSAEPS